MQPYSSEDLFSRPKFLFFVFLWKDSTEGLLRNVVQSCSTWLEIHSLVHIVSDTHTDFFLMLLARVFNFNNEGIYNIMLNDQGREKCTFISGRLVTSMTCIFLL